MTGKRENKWLALAALAGALAMIVVRCLVAAVAPSAGTLIAARAPQGICRAAVLPSSLSSVNSIFRARNVPPPWRLRSRHVRCRSHWPPAPRGIHYPPGPALELLGQRASGPIGPFGIWKVVPETTTEHKEHGTDVFGVLLSALGFGLLVFILIEGPTWG